MRSARFKIYMKLTAGMFSLVVISGLAAFVVDAFNDQIDEKLNDQAAKSSSVRAPASRGRVLEPFTPISDLQPDQIFVLTAIRGVRGQRVTFHPETIVTQNRREPARYVRLNLFRDVAVTVRLQKPSNYGVNSFLYAGLVEGNPKSHVRLQISGAILDGIVDTGEHQYRIMDGGGGTHVVIELPPSSK